MRCFSTLLFLQSLVGPEASCSTLFFLQSLESIVSNAYASPQQCPWPAAQHLRRYPCGAVPRGEQLRVCLVSTDIPDGRDMDIHSYKLFGWMDKLDLDIHNKEYSR
jgi:hypothetical protein